MLLNSSALVRLRFNTVVHLVRCGDNLIKSIITSPAASGMQNRKLSALKSLLNAMDSSTSITCTRTNYINTMPSFVYI